MRIKESLKTSALILLTISMLALFSATWGYSLGAGGQGFSLFPVKRTDSGTDKEKPPAVFPAAYPVKAAADAGSGLYGACGGIGELDTLYERVRPILAEAIGSAGEFTPAGESEFEAALSKKMVYLFYNGKVPLFLIGEWLGASMQNNPEISAGGILLCAAQESISIYCRDAESGKVFISKTAALSENLISAVSSFGGNGCAFASGGGIEQLLPETLIFSSAPELETLVASNMVDGAEHKHIQAVLSAFSFNPYTVRKYEELDKTQVYVGEESTLQIYPDGDIRYLAQDPAYGLYIAGLPAADEHKKLAFMVEAARALYEKMLQSVASDAALQFCRYEYDGENDTYTLSFDYMSENTPVLTKDYAFTATISNDRITGASLRLRRFQKTGEASLMIPQIQAAAAIELSRPGAKTMMTACFRDDGNGLFRAKWNHGEEY